MQRLITAAILLVALLVAHAQGSDEISGHYKDRTGLAIDFPKGWTGSDKIGFPIVGPDGFVPGGQWPSVNMAVMSTDAAKAKEMWQNPNYRYSLNSNSACEELARDYVMVGKVRASEVVKECKDSDYSKTKTYSIATKDSIIVIRLSADSSKGYDSHVKEFDKAIGTIQVKAVDMRNAIKSMSGMQGVQGKATMSGKQFTIKMDTTSKVSNLELAKGVISFEVAGKKGTRGVAEVSIGAFLNGPFEATVDGKRTDDFKVTHDRTTGETLLAVNYGHDSKHRVAITGAL